ncbi:MAG TPA: hypothetical protein ENK57_26375 [Polyangiaceae bacterium]|nr:hypothetical protein [Polyangiaceae bacterium]
MRARDFVARLGLLAALMALPTPSTAAEGQDAKPWCAPEFETLAGDVCYHPAPAPKGDAPKRRTAVIFLHGLVPAGEGWQHNQQRGILRGAQAHGFAVFAPRGREGIRPKEPLTVAWPTSASAQKEHEAAVLAEWKAAIDLVEKRDGEPFDEVFVLGFSNGAYYTGSLAIRAPHPFDGYAVFAGGRAYGVPTSDPSRRAPVFVGICTKDSTAKDGQSLAATLRKHGWPFKAERRPVGHTVADKHLAHAMAFLRE